jgi:phage virion morphogenesis protein
VSDLSPIDSFASGLVAALEPAARRALAKELAKALRASQSKRIAAQLNPDGTPYEPRKPQLRKKKGKLRRTMFAKIRSTKYLKAEGTDDAAIVSFTREVERIAKVHQLGLRDRVSRKTGLEANYPARRLLGISESDEALIRELVTEHLAVRL